MHYFIYRWTAGETKYITKHSFMFLVFQAEEPGLGENKDPGTEHAEEDIAEDHVGEKGEEATEPEQAGEEEASTEDTDKPETASKPDAGDAEEAVQDTDKASTGVNVKDPEPINGENGGAVEEDKEKVEAETTEKDGEEVKDQCKDEEKSKSEEKATEEKKDLGGKAPKEAEEKKQVKEVDVEMKEKGKMKEGEKQGKPRRKGGAPSSCLSRPRPSARSIRASRKNDIIAKFQQGAPE